MGRRRRGQRRAPRSTLDLPHDLMHIIFSNLDFDDKVNAGQVSKLWDQLLRANAPAARHWDVYYDLDAIASSPFFTTDVADFFAEQPHRLIVR
jgi:hypothetical protein